LRRRHPALRHLAFGDLFLADVRAYRERLLAGLDWEPLFPLWARDTSQLAAEFVDAVSRDPYLRRHDATRRRIRRTRFRRSTAAALPTGVDPCGERRIHTCVHAGPIFPPASAARHGGAHVLRDNGSRIATWCSTNRFEIPEQVVVAAPPPR
jgi:diphthamide synthase (EF-2-diphthine--ammonia ligase)